MALCGFTKEFWADVGNFSITNDEWVLRALERGHEGEIQSLREHFLLEMGCPVTMTEPVFRRLHGLEPLKD